MHALINGIPTAMDIIVSLNYKKIIIGSILMIIICELLYFIKGNIYKAEDNRKDEIRKVPRVSLYLLIVYTNVVLRLTLLGREIGSREHSVARFYFSLDEIFSIHGALNLLMFVPFGFGTFMVFRNYKKYESLMLAFLISTVFTILIELIQYITETGRFEISDLVCNAAGGLVGGIAALLVILIAKMLSENEA